MNNLTDLENKVLATIVYEGADTICSNDPEDVKCDNMTWTDAADLKKATGLGLQAIGGIMASLAEKGMIADSGEPLPEKKGATNAWYATNDGIDAILS